MRTAGRRLLGGDAWADQGRLARTAAFLRGSRGLVPRGVFRFATFGVFRFATFEEAEAWMTRTTIDTHVRRSRRTSSGSAAR